MPRKPINHGTNAGYFQHRRRGETPCEKCKKAHSDTSRKWRQQWARRWYI